MKAALCKSLDGPGAIVIEEIAEPIPATGEVVVQRQGSTAASSDEGPRARRKPLCIG